MFRVGDRATLRETSDIGIHFWGKEVEITEIFDGREVYVRVINNNSKG